MQVGRSCSSALRKRPEGRASIGERSDGGQRLRRATEQERSKAITFFGFSSSPFKGESERVLFNYLRKSRPHPSSLPIRATGVFRVVTECHYGLTKGSESPLATEGRPRESPGHQAPTFKDGSPIPASTNPAFRLSRGTASGGQPVSTQVIAATRSASCNRPGLVWGGARRV